MLKGIHPAIGPELLKVLAEMGHGDEIILADAHFPGHSFNDQVLRTDGVKITTLLDGILPLIGDIASVKRFVTEPVSKV